MRALVERLMSIRVVCVVGRWLLACTSLDFLSRYVRTGIFQGMRSRKVR